MKFNHLTCFFMLVMLISSCTSRDKFPMTVSDIDTLSVYRHHLDSLENVAAAGTSDSIISRVQLQEEKRQYPGMWTICTGVFRMKENARRKFNEVNHTSGACIILRDSMHYVTTGIFSTKDSALQFRKNHHLLNTYILKIKPQDQLLHSFPE